MKFRILEPALAELSGAAHFYETRETGLGKAFLAEYEKTLKRIARFPLASTPMSKNCRRSMLKRFPYAILFFMEEEMVLIVAVMHLHREPDYWQKRVQ